jgi:transcriptional regulator with XRE-family HTH domain
MRGVLANGSAIVAFRLERGLTQDQLAAEARLDVKTIRKAEQGQRIDASTLSRLSMALGADLSRLIANSTAAPDEQLSWRDIILRWREVWEAHDMEGMLPYYHPDATVTLPGGPALPIGGAFRGRDEIRRLHEIVWSTVPQEPMTGDDFTLVVNGDSVTMTGQRTIYLPTGEPMLLSCVMLFQIRDNQIATQEVYYDTLQFAKQMQLAH